VAGEAYTGRNRGTVAVNYYRVARACCAVKPQSWRLCHRRGAHHEGGVGCQPTPRCEKAMAHL